MSHDDSKIDNPRQHERSTMVAPSNHLPLPSPATHHRSGFCPETKTFHSLRPAVPLPTSSLPLSFPAFALSLLPSPLPTHPALVGSAAGNSLSFREFFSRVHALGSALKTYSAAVFSGGGAVAFVLSPASLDIPVLYFALLSIGAAVAPANPAATAAEISRLVRLTAPSIAFATSSTASKLPGDDLPTIILDSPLFQSFLSATEPPAATTATVRQSDVAAIQFSSGTTGRMKAAALTHRSFIAMTAGFHALRPRPESRARPEVTLLTAPLFHSLGFFVVMKAIALGETTVVVDHPATVPEMLQDAERYRVTQITAAPPLVVAMSRLEKALRIDLSALQRIFCGGSPLPAESAERFSSRFPNVLLCQGYGSTEGGGISRMIDVEECHQRRSAGRLSENVEAKIVDTITEHSLSVGQKGELLIKSPALKEMIKYNAYQVLIGYPDEQAGQIPMAFVVRQPGSKITEVEVMNFVAKQVAPYKKIRRVAFIGSIPKTAAGKILRRELAATALSHPFTKL
ncbi:4-coumarate--CoA ligase-like 7 [Apostasia shenzhenica]|uniref:4-coumarate--CoA ligase n=1 Tax=Apostasia shenzhenica TaxID=1088818 RepID=A0A2I0B0F9_9ASPA|nr:4-coumarate--CoA ligase-like 7 [Apostasia shenzhenica]